MRKNVNPSVMMVWILGMPTSEGDVAQDFGALGWRVSHSGFGGFALEVAQVGRELLTRHKLRHASQLCV